MLQYGHYGCALLVYAPVAFATLLFGVGELAIPGGILTLGLAMLPDADNRVPGLAHRGPTHTVLFALCVGLVVAAVAAVLVTAASPTADLLTVEPDVAVSFAFLVGTLSVLSHLLADALTPAGIRPFWPVSRRRYALGVARAGNPLANNLLLVLGVLATAAVVAAGSLV